MPMKNSPTPAGIEPATFGIVAQHLNHCATAVPQFRDVLVQIYFQIVEIIKKCRYKYSYIAGRFERIKGRETTREWRWQPAGHV